MPDGRDRYVLSYDEAEYSLRHGDIDEMRFHGEGHGSRLLLADGRDGPFSRFIEFCGFLRDGRQWIVLWNFMEGYAIEVELTDDELGETNPLPPQTAWHIMRALETDDLIIEGPEPAPDAYWTSRIMPGCLIRSR